MSILAIRRHVAEVIMSGCQVLKLAFVVYDRVESFVSLATKQLYFLDFFFFQSYKFQYQYLLFTYETHFFSYLKFASPWMRCVLKILEDFTEGNSRKSQKRQKHIYLGIYNSRLQRKILTQMITKHYSIIAYC